MFDFALMGKNFETQIRGGKSECEIKNMEFILLPTLTASH